MDSKINQILMVNLQQRQDNNLIHMDNLANQECPNNLAIQANLVNNLAIQVNLVNNLGTKDNLDNPDNQEHLEEVSGDKVRPQLRFL
jgi:hypothetical protein